jgi:hypothetical protein
MAGISIAEATARWHFHHSQLTAEDGVIMGSVRMRPRTCPVAGWLVAGCYTKMKITPACHGGAVVIFPACRHRLLRSRKISH